MRGVHASDGFVGLPLANEGTSVGSTVVSVGTSVGVIPVAEVSAVGIALGAMLPPRLHASVLRKPKINISRMPMGRFFVVCILQLYYYLALSAYWTHREMPLQWMGLPTRGYGDAL